MAKVRYSFNPVPNSFIPKIKDVYWSINENSLVLRHTWNGFECDKQRLRHNNVFGTLKLAKASRDKEVAARKSVHTSALSTAS